jgi:hypothetical protein
MSVEKAMEQFNTLTDNSTSSLKKYVQVWTEYYSGGTEEAKTYMARDFIRRIAFNFDIEVLFPDYEA